MKSIICMINMNGFYPVNSLLYNSNAHAPFDLYKDTILLVLLYECSTTVNR